MTEHASNDEPQLVDSLRVAPRTLFWTAEDFAVELRVGLRTLWRLHQTGKIPLPCRIGRNCRWRRSECEVWQEFGCPDRQTWEAMKAEGNVPGLEPYPAARKNARARRQHVAGADATEDGSGRMNTMR